MKITILGSGTSTGVPEYKCDCETCEDARDVNSKNYRTRSSIHIEKDGKHLQLTSDLILWIRSSEIGLTG